jgi:hypothetical protein
MSPMILLFAQMKIVAMALYLEAVFDMIFSLFPIVNGSGAHQAILLGISDATSKLFTVIVNGLSMFECGGQLSSSLSTGVFRRFKDGSAELFHNGGRCGQCRSRSRSWHLKDSDAGHSMFTDALCCLNAKPLLYYPNLRQPWRYWPSVPRTF